MRLFETLFQKDRAFGQKVLEGGVPTEDIKEYLLRNYTVYDLATLSAELIEETYRYTQPIALKEEDYNKVLSLFRIRGIRADGKFETRGNKAKIFTKTEDIFSK